MGTVSGAGVGRGATEKADGEGWRGGSGGGLRTPERGDGRYRGVRGLGVSRGVSVVL